jgi:hypothetical protein
MRKKNKKPFAAGSFFVCLIWTMLLCKAVSSQRGELEQIQFLLGHASVLTMERYLGCKQNLKELVNDRFGCLFSRTLDLR